MYLPNEFISVSTLGMPLLRSIAFATALVMCEPPAKAGPAPVTVGGPFALTASDGTTVTDETYRGKWLLVFFGYTFCPDLCPTTLNEISLALTKLGVDAEKLQAIFITVDPERDTREVMREYTRAFDPRIAGLTGTPQQIAAVAREYGAYAEPRGAAADAHDYLVDHSTYIYIMDPQGKFVRGLDFDTPSGDIADTLLNLMASSGE